MSRLDCWAQRAVVVWCVVFVLYFAWELTR
jgi:hypothetical protein